MKIPLHLILIYFLCRIHPRPTMSDEVFCEELDKSPFHRDRYRGFLSVPTGSQNAIFLILIIHSKTCVCKSNNTYKKICYSHKKKRTRAFWRMPSNYLHYLLFFYPSIAICFFSSTVGFASFFATVTVSIPCSK